MQFFPFIISSLTYLMLVVSQVQSTPFPEPSLKQTVPQAASFPSSLKGKGIKLKGYIEGTFDGHVYIHASQLGRIKFDPLFPLPEIGEKVTTGQALAIVEILPSYSDKASRKADLHNFEAEALKHAKEVKRLEKLGDFTSKKLLEEERIERDKLNNQRKEMLKFLEREVLSSPIEGIVSAVFKKAGQVVPPEAPIMEIITPGKIKIIAYSDGYELLDNIQHAYMKIPKLNDKTYPLIFKGAAEKIEKDKGRAMVFSLACDADHPELLIGMEAEITFIRE